MNRKRKMSKKSCSFEKDVIKSLNADQVKQDIKKHREECPVCKDAVLIYRWLNNFKNISRETDVMKKKLLEPESIWIGAHSLQKTDRELVKKAMRPLAFSRLFSYVVVVFGLIFLFISSSPFKSDMVLNSLSLATKAFTQFFPYFIIPGLIIFFSMTFCALMTAFEKR